MPGDFWEHHGAKNTGKPLARIRQLRYFAARMENLDSACPERFSVHVAASKHCVMQARGLRKSIVSNEAASAGLDRVRGDGSPQDQTPDALGPVGQLTTPPLPAASVPDVRDRISAPAVIAREQCHAARHWHPLKDGRIQCDICPHDCKLLEGQRGACFVRGRSERGMVLTTYGRSSGFSIHPIERKPLNHFFPGSSVVSVGTAGCNLACGFCENGDISRSRDVDRLAEEASPLAIARAARAHGSKSVAFTYNDPVVFFEYALDTADACHELGLKTVAVTAGYMHAAPRWEFYARMDAANIDLKAFSEDAYVKLAGAHLKSVLDTLIHVRYATDCWLEISTLLIPGHNDSAAEVSALAHWVAGELGPNVPLHFNAFRPDWKMKNVPPTTPAALGKARRVALDAGLNHVYTDKAHDIEGGTTFCPGCGRATVVRDCGDIRHYELTAQGACAHCGMRIAGCFGEFVQPFGDRRIPLVMNARH